MTKRKLLFVSFLLLGWGLIRTFYPWGTSQEAWGVPGQNATRASIPTLTPTPTDLSETPNDPDGDDDNETTPASATLPASTPVLIPSPDHTPSRTRDPAPSLVATKTPPAATRVVVGATQLPSLEVIQSAPSRTSNPEVTITLIANTVTPSPDEKSVTLTPIVDSFVIGGALTLFVVGFILLKGRSEQPESN